MPRVPRTSKSAADDHGREIYLTFLGLHFFAGKAGFSLNIVEMKRPRKVLSISQGTCLLK